MTRQALELGREFLMEQRDVRLELLHGMLWVLKAARAGRVDAPDLVDEAAGVLAAQTCESAEFSSMVRCWLRAEFGASLCMPLTREDLLAYARGAELPGVEPGLAR